MNSLPKTVTRQRRECDLNPGPSAPELKRCSYTIVKNMYQFYPSQDGGESQLAS